MTDEEMKKVAIKASVFAAISITLMLQRSATKHIMITDAAGAPVDRGKSDSAYTLLIDDNVPKGKEDALIIPLPKSVSSDNIVLEDRYIDHELSIYIDSREEGFYLDNPVVTSLPLLESAVCINENDTGSVCLDFKLDDLYVNESALTENSTIEVRFFKPKDKFEHVVVVDPAGGGKDTGDLGNGYSEKDVALDTALLLKTAADKDTEHNIKLYFTRLSDMDTSLEKRKALIEDSGADLFVELSCDGVQDEAYNGMAIYYNDKFFLRRLSNAEFADVLLQGYASENTLEVLGVFPEKEDGILGLCPVPAARISLGNVYGQQDKDRLSDESYKSKAAEGIYDGILEAFEVME
ncbi:MAG: N-acetylmuramoyl-L-alanine amidase [Butyrivibrio sp.]|nr:N-acetylmuramoyl-L-alanine amidase [Butyrivibrio sp.]